MKLSSFCQKIFAIANDSNGLEQNTKVHPLLSCVCDLGIDGNYLPPNSWLYNFFLSRSIGKENLQYLETEGYWRSFTNTRMVKSDLTKHVENIKYQSLH